MRLRSSPASSRQLARASARRRRNLGEAGGLEAVSDAAGGGAEAGAASADHDRVEVMVVDFVVADLQPCLFDLR